ncbi:LysR substrate-binding domain-containing protein [Cupriavidus basilensis]
MASLDAPCRMVHVGLGIAVVPRQVGELYLNTLDVAARPLADAWATRQLVVVFQSREQLSASAAALVGFLSAGNSGNSANSGNSGIGNGNDSVQHGSRLEPRRLPCRLRTLARPAPKHIVGPSERESHDGRHHSIQRPRAVPVARPRLRARPA